MGKKKRFTTNTMATAAARYTIRRVMAIVSSSVRDAMVRA